MRVYVASSWRNPYQPGVVKALREEGHRVYDFREPGPGVRGFSWAEVSDQPPETWSLATYKDVVRRPRAEEAFLLDSTHLDEADAVVLVLPAGNDAHLEAAYAAGRKKYVVAFAPGEFTPGLMYGLLDLVTDDLYEVVKCLRAKP